MSRFFQSQIFLIRCLYNLGTTVFYSIWSKWKCCFLKFWLLYKLINLFFYDTLVQTPVGVFLHNLRTFGSTFKTGTTSSSVPYLQYLLRPPTIWTSPPCSWHHRKLLCYDHHPRQNKVSPVTFLKNYTAPVLSLYYIHTTIKSLSPGQYVHVLPVRVLYTVPLILKIAETETQATFRMTKK